MLYIIEENYILRKNSMKKLSYLLLLLISFTFISCLSTPDNENDKTKNQKEKIAITFKNNCNWRVKLSFFYENDTRDYIPVLLEKEPQTVELYKDSNYEMGIIGAYDINASRYLVHIDDKDVWIIDWDIYKNEYVIYMGKNEE